MKKLIIKLAAFSIVSVLISANAALADGGSGGYKMSDRLDTEKAAQCIKDLPKDHKCTKESTEDGCYLVTFIEEPLDVKSGTSADFKQKICYRHTLQWTDKDTKEVKTLEELSTIPCKTLADVASDAPTDLQVKYSCRQIQAVLSKGGTSLLYGYIGMVYRWGASMVGIVAVLVIVISGIQISAGGGDPEAINSAKKRIIQSIAGIVVLFLSGLILYTINPTFFTK